jgi:hypothetical protein
MSVSRLFTIPFFLVFCSSVLAQDLPKSAPSGFLSDYSRLTPDLSIESDLHSYIAPEAAVRHLGNVYITPLTSYPENANFEFIDRATLAELESKFNASLNAHLGGKITLVSTPELADTIIQMAVTEVKAIEPNRKVIDFLPIRLITKPIKDAAMGKQQEIVVTIEMKMRDVKTDKIIYESVESAKGKTMGRTGDANLHANSKELDPVIDSWVNKTAQVFTQFPH